MRSYRGGLARSALVVPTAKRHGGPVVIVNAEPTEMDNLADAVIRGSISELLPILVGERERYLSRVGQRGTTKATEPVGSRAGVRFDATEPKPMERASEVNTQ